MQTNTLQLMPFHGEEVVSELVTQEDRLKKCGQQVEELAAPELWVGSLSIDLPKQQCEDTALVQCFKEANKDFLSNSLSEGFYLKMTFSTEKVSMVDSLSSPKSCREKIEDSHTILWAGHLGFMKTFMCISKRLGMYSQVKEYYKTCRLTAGKDWDKWLSFAYQKVNQASMAFLLFTLLYAHQVRGSLDVVCEAWEGPGKSQGKNTVSYVLKMLEQLMRSTAMARGNHPPGTGKAEGMV